MNGNQKAVLIMLAVLLIITTVTTGEAQKVWQTIWVSGANSPSKGELWILAGELLLIALLVALAGNDVAGNIVTWFVVGLWLVFLMSHLDDYKGFITQLTTGKIAGGN